MDNHCVMCGAYLADTGRMVCEKCEKPKKDELKNCPVCGKKPILGYACGEYFVFGDDDDCPCCGLDFGEMHSNDDFEVEVWNRRVERWKLN